MRLAAGGSWVAWIFHAPTYGLTQSLQRGLRMKDCQPKAGLSGLQIAGPQNFDQARQILCEIGDEWLPSLPWKDSYIVGAQ